MASEVDICNLALGHVGALPINALSEATSEARACNLHFNQARDTLLAAHDWWWARKRESLAEVTNDWSVVWEYAYQVPSDLLRVRRIGDDTGAFDDRKISRGVAYNLMGGVLFTSVSPAICTYTYRVEDPTRFSPLFVDALSWALAARVAMQITKEARLRNDAIEMASRSLQVAMAQDGNDDGDTSDITSEFVTVRD